MVMSLADLKRFIADYLEVINSKYFNQEDLQLKRAEAWRAAFFFEYYNAPGNTRGQLPLLPTDYSEGISLIRNSLK